MTEQVKQDKITIDGKDYIISELPLDVRNTIYTAVIIKMWWDYKMQCICKWSNYIINSSL